MDFAARTEYHSTKVKVWYPALNPTGAAESITYDRGLIGHAILQAAPDTANGPYPLVIFAHGLNDINVASSYLSEHLASYGFVLMAINYADNWLTPVSIPYPATLLITRPRDISWQIDYATMLTADGGALPNMIDIEHVAVTGHSMGANTTLAAGGARYTTATSPDDWCVNYPETILAPELGGGDICDYSAEEVAQSIFEEVAPMLGLETMPEDLYPALGDPRVDAIIPLAPGMDPFGAIGTKSVSIPTMILVGSQDQFIFSSYDKYLPWVYNNLSSDRKSLVLFEHGDHYVFYTNCADGHVPDAYSWICSDPVWDMDRAHDLINHFVTAFLLAELKGDADAAAALAPDAVSFPGIEYQAQGF